MKLYAATTWYNPTISEMKNILTYSDYFEKLYIYDNSPLRTDISKIFDEKTLSKIDYRNTGKNIAMGAFSIILKEAVYENADFILTMDQDTWFDKEDIERYINRVETTPSDDIALFNASYNGYYLKKDTYSKKIATASNMVNLHNYELLLDKCTDGGYNERLFIDHVDYDLDYQFYKIGKKILNFKDVKVHQQFGTTVRRKFLFLDLSYRTYSPIRYYYTERNYIYLQRKYRKEGNGSFFGFRRHFIHYPSVAVKMFLLREENYKEKIKMMRLGRKHGKKGCLGTIEEATAEYNRLMAIKA